MPAESARLVGVTRPTTTGKGATVTFVVLRVVGGGLLATNAGIHAYLWQAGYRTIPAIGLLFLLDVIGASVLVIAVLLSPRGIVPVVAAAGALLELGTAGGLLLATRHSLFGFMESSRATLYQQSLVTELAGAVALALLALLAVHNARSGATTRRW